VAEENRPTFGSLEAAKAGLWRIGPGDGAMFTIEAASEAFSVLAGTLPFQTFHATMIHRSGHVLFEEAMTAARPSARIDILVPMLFGMRFVPTRFVGAWNDDATEACGIAIPSSLSDAFGDSGYDQVTGLLDRTTFRSALASLSEGGGVVALVNVDRFRRWNETLGHDSADAALSALSERMMEIAGPRALAARVGADELAVFVRHADPVVLTTSLTEAMTRRLKVRGVEVHPSITVVAVPMNPGEPGARALLEAELAIEQARAERPVAQLHSFAPPTGPNRLALEADLMRGLRAGEFEPFFQPVVRLSTGEISGFEALTRWRHPTRGILSPIVFLGLAAEIGVLGEIGQITMARAARQLSIWREQTGRPLVVSVNLTSAELDRPELLHEVAEAIHAGSLPPGALELEITEDQVMRDPARISRTLSLLRSSGAGVALDDFGVGFSSLAWLAQLPADRLKLDRFFVRTATQGGGATTIIRAIAALARELDMSIVAEGIEDEEIRSTVEALGCTHGQGYLWSPPVDAATATQMLQPQAEENVGQEREASAA
jgi:c-di-GMP-specific phosphodiesterase